MYKGQDNENDHKKEPIQHIKLDLAVVDKNKVIEQPQKLSCNGFKNPCLKKLKVKRGIGPGGREYGSGTQLIIFFILYGNESE